MYIARAQKETTFLVCISCQVRFVKIPERLGDFSFFFSNLRWSVADRGLMEGIERVSGGMDEQGKKY